MTYAATLLSAAALILATISLRASLAWSRRVLVSPQAVSCPDLEQYVITAETVAGLQDRVEALSAAVDALAALPKPLDLTEWKLETEEAFSRGLAESRGTAKAAKATADEALNRLVKLEELPPPSPDLSPYVPRHEIADLISAGAAAMIGHLGGEGPEPIRFPDGPRAA